MSTAPLVLLPRPDADRRTAWRTYAGRSELVEMIATVQFAPSARSVQAGSNLALDLFDIASLFRSD
jgi:hypothetical protein